MSGSSKNEQYLQAVETSFDRAISAGIVHLSTQDEEFNGRTVQIDGRDYVNFSSCSYLGLELDPRLKAAAKNATDRYGTQFSSSRAYISIGLYDELESLLEEVFDQPVIVAPTTTLGHMSTLPIIVGDNDVVILDHQVHASINMAAQMLKGRGVRLEMIRHNNMDMLEGRIRKLSESYDKIWYMADGIYSMFGDSAPITELLELHDKYPQLHLYIDDAHGVSWHGKNGRGFIAEQLGDKWPSRLYMTGSMAKSFGCVGGILIFPDESSREAVRKMGGTLIFSGPIQPPLLAAAITSVRLHLSSELKAHQSRLKRRIIAFEANAEGLGLPTSSDILSPIRFIKVGHGELAFRITEEVKKKGFYCNPASFPSVPHKESGLRMTIHNHLKISDIEQMLYHIHEAWVRIAGDMKIPVPASLEAAKSRVAM